MFSGFPPSTKTNIFKFHFDLETVERRATPWIPLKFLLLLLSLLIELGVDSSQAFWEYPAVTVRCLLTWHLNERQARADFTFIQSLLYLSFVLKQTQPPTALLSLKLHSAKRRAVNVKHQL